MSGAAPAPPGGSATKPRGVQCECAHLPRHRLRRSAQPRRGRRDTSCSPASHARSPPSPAGDEVTIAEHDKERGTRQKISEPKTPYRRVHPRLAERALPTATYDLDLTAHHHIAHPAPVLAPHFSPPLNRRPQHTSGGPDASHSPASSVRSDDSAFMGPASSGADAAASGGGDPRLAAVLAGGWGDGGAHATAASSGAGSGTEAWDALEARTSMSSSRGSTGGDVDDDMAVDGSGGGGGGRPSSAGLYAGGTSPASALLRRHSSHAGMHAHFDGAGGGGASAAAAASSSSAAVAAAPPLAAVSAAPAAPDAAGPPPALQIGVDSHDAESGEADRRGFTSKMKRHYAGEFAAAAALRASMAMAADDEDDDEDEGGGGGGDDVDMDGGR